MRRPILRGSLEMIDSVLNIGARLTVTLRQEEGERTKRGGGVVKGADTYTQGHTHALT